MFGGFGAAINHTSIFAQSYHYEIIAGGALASALQPDHINELTSCSARSGRRIQALLGRNRIA
jgi:hypothetical protein